MKEHNFGPVSDLCLNDGCEAEAGDDTPCPSPKQFNYWWLPIVAIIVALIILIPLMPISAPPPQCKVCHCGQTKCHRECSEESMCAMRCEGLCNKK